MHTIHDVHINYNTHRPPFMKYLLATKVLIFCDYIIYSQYATYNVQTMFYAQRDIDTLNEPKHVGLGWVGGEYGLCINQECVMKEVQQCTFHQAIMNAWIIVAYSLWLITACTRCCAQISIILQLLNECC